MLKDAHMPLRRQPFELGKAMDALQHGIMNAGLSLVIPRPMRLRMRGDEPEIFDVSTTPAEGDGRRVAANMVNCREWVYLDRLI